MAKTIYLDESGCLGWKLDEAYRRGGSSRHFTLAAAVLPDGDDAVLNRVVRGIYKQRGRSVKNEIKSVALSPAEREHFARQLAAIKRDKVGFQFATITVRKENVSAGFRRHPNGLYNYMVGLLLLELMAREPAVAFIPDARTVRIELKHAMHDYLCTKLSALGADTFLETTPWESKDSLCLQFADILAGIVWGNHEFRTGNAYKIVSPHVRQKRLFFDPPQKATLIHAEWATYQALDFDPNDT
ncbi:DUF3800 domain-containing protein [Paraburkholderia sediminicola]|uniref:DUF3800 domain-containing protein n=1 Tax=Paraburkholderia sediminicola TaxID=458836 RepID=UPI0038BADB07